MVPSAELASSLVASAVSAQFTLFRLTRVFSQKVESKRLDAAKALRHGPTANLVWQLHRCWKVLGLSSRTVFFFLRECAWSIGGVTMTGRWELVSRLEPVTTGVDPAALSAFVEEGRSQ